MKKLKSDYITFIAFLLIIAAMIMFAYYNYIYNVNSCTSDPLKYAVEKIREEKEAEFVSGEMRIIVNKTSFSWGFGDGSNLLLPIQP